MPDLDAYVKQATTMATRRKERPVDPEKLIPEAKKRLHRYGLELVQSGLSPACVATLFAVVAKELVQD